MPRLIGLKGITTKETECEWFSKPMQLKRILDSGKAATTAGDNGAINIWKDDEGFIRCEAQRWCRTINERKFSKISEVRTWANEWLLNINS